MILYTCVAADGSYFGPHLRRASGFQIGPKGGEMVVPDFAQAVAKLKSMKKAYWRRPNVQGNWGIVVGVEWRELKVKNE